MPFTVEPIAIIGHAFRLPPDVEDESSFWEMLENGRNVKTEWPESRANLESFYSENTKQGNTLKARGAHFCAQDPGVFDAPFFSITSKEAASMDPQQRWLLETSYRALENAGIAAETVSGTYTGVFAASMTEDYTRIISKDPDEALANTGTGNNASILANRLSWYFDLRGPSITVNTACSSSMVAMHLACQSLQSGQCSAALVGGASALLSVESSLHLSAMQFLSPDDLCHSFDKQANGYARGEGVVVIMLKKLVDAVRDGDIIRAVIRATGTNQDGHTPGITLPNPAAQEDLIRRVYRSCDLNFDETRYFEAHGTGTQAGDSAEVNALGRVFRNSRSAKEPLYIGSVKSNIGHLEGASALAGILKCTLILERGLIPPQALFQKMNPKINARFYNIQVPTKCTPWPSTGLRRVSINSFGFGGSNGHMILDDGYHTLERLSLNAIHNTLVPLHGAQTQVSSEKYEPLPIENGGPTNTSSISSRSFGGSATDATSMEAMVSDTYTSTTKSRLLIFSARDEAAIRRIIEQYSTYYPEKINESPENAGTLAYTLSERRSLMPWRSFAVAHEIPGATLNFSVPVRSSRDTGLAFVFTGQGAQYAGMGKELLQYRTFREALSLAGEIFKQEGASWDVLGELENAERIHSPALSQPLCTALQIALVDLLKSWNITPTAVIGHSSGEIGAAYTIGALSVESACRIAFHRGRLAAEVARTGSGAMMSVNLSEDMLDPYVMDIPLSEDIHVACINSPLNITLSGKEADLDTLKTRLDGDGIFAQKLKTGVAYHSPAMHSIAKEYESCLSSLTQGVRCESSAVMISSVTGTIVSASKVSQPQYWVTNLVSPVQFTDALEYATVIAPKDGHDLKLHEFLEIGPHGALRRSINDTMARVGKKIRYTSLLSRFDSAMKTSLEAAGGLFTRGAAVNIAAVNQIEKPSKASPALVDMPPYPFDRSQIYWHESRFSRDWRLRGAAPRDVLGVRSSDWNPLEPRWRKMLSIEDSPWIGDHIVGDMALYPGSGTFIMALEAVRQNLDPSQKILGFFVKDATYMAPIVVKPGVEGQADVVTHLYPLRQTYEKTSLRFEVRIFCLQDKRWQQSFKATIHVEYEESHTNGIDAGRETRAEAEKHFERWKQIDENCKMGIDKSDFYKWAAAAGIKYGDAFQLTDDVRWDGDLLGVSRVRTDVVEHEYQGLVHPAVFDAVCQTVFAAPSKGGRASFPTLVPHKMQDAWISATAWQTPQSSIIRTATVSRQKKGVIGMDCALTAVAEDGSPLLHISNFEMLPVLTKNEAENSERSLLYGYEWSPILSLLHPTRLRELCSIDDSTEKDVAHDRYIHQLNDTLHAILHHNLRDVRMVDVSTRPPHFEKYMTWLEGHLQGSYIVHERSLEVLNSEIEQLQTDKPDRKVTIEVARNLPALLKGDIDPLDFLFSNDLVSSLYNDVFADVCNQRFQTYMDLLSHQTPTMRILEVGAGTGSFSSPILESLRRREEATGGISFSEYNYTDISTSFFENAKESFAYFGDRIKFQQLDIESDLQSQGFGESEYDVIFAGSVLHATRDLSQTLKNLRVALKPGGKLVIMEPTRPDLLLDGIVFGLLPGWWLGVEEFRADGPLLKVPQWDQILRDNGFSGNDLVIKDHESDASHAYSIIASTVCKESLAPGNSKELSVIYVIDDGNDLQQQTANALSYKSVSPGTVVTFSELENDEKATASHVVFLCEMDNAFLAEIDAVAFNILKKRVLEWKNLLWVSTCAGPSLAPYEGVKDGFLRAVRSEAEHKHVVTLTLETALNATTHIVKVFTDAFLGESPELEYSVRDDVLCIPRLVAETRLNSRLNASIHPQPSTSAWLPGPPLKVDIQHHGSLETLHFSEDAQYYEPLKPNDIEMQAKAWDLNFRDVFIALGRLEEDTFGDCAGIVTRVGADVHDFTIGDRVVMMGPGAMKMYARAQQWIAKIPDGMSFEEAASVLNPGICAYYSLIEVARLQKGEKILIHAAAGGTGQMAVIVAQMLGAEVFCTVGSREKKELLINQYGVPEDHIFYSRNTSFKKGVLRVTNGYGVDVVLNSIVGEGLRASFECVAPYGRFIELGKADIKSRAQLPMECFLNNVTFTAIDVVHLATHRPQIGERVFREVMELARRRAIRSPQPMHIFGVNKVEEAFRYIQSGRNTGRTIISIQEEAIVQKRLLQHKTWLFNPNATYLIAGGMGGIGRAMMKWLAFRGAKHIIVPSRSSRSAATMQAAMETVEQLRKQGIQVAIPRCDVSSAESLRNILDDCAKTMPPVRGCINAAMVLQDSVFDNMTHSQWTQTIESKVATSWNLHTHLPDLDFFVMLASVAGVVGSPGQSNYAAGCTFQDALCRQRVKQGQKAISIDLGVMRTIGIVAETGRLQKNFGESLAMKKIEETEFLGLLDLYCDPELPTLTPDKSQIIMGAITPADMIAKGEEPIDHLCRPMFANFAQPKDVTKNAGSEDVINFSALFARASGHEERARIVVEALAHKLARALSISPDDVDSDKPLHVFGVDSLVAVELRNWVGKEFAAEVAVFDIMGSPSVVALGDVIAKVSKVATKDGV
ncbi:polyketide synthase PksD [Massarina eburnea CBS 473.64]|uniref:Polyketide synthase PksD n=1 Tax=Massarina eburnea CBS 473.64 TaxID=1395130 RepID=A0A6A6RTL5_9PLEO|nr:polyketide synthase PksD [Massarina eburnea CBS 473.64]